MSKRLRPIGDATGGVSGEIRGVEVDDVDALDPINCVFASDCIATDRERGVAGGTSADSEQR